MLIDINSYCGHWPFRNVSENSLIGLSELALDNGITHMVVANINGFFYKDANTANIELYEQMKEYSGEMHFLPLAIVNPTYPEWENDAIKMLELGFCGFELAPRYHGYSLAPEMLYDEYMPKHRAREVLSLAEKYDVPVRICASVENFRGRSRMDTQDNLYNDELFALLSANRNVNVMITGFNPAVIDDKLCGLIKERGKTYFDITQVEGFMINNVKTAMAKVDAKYFCFGSGLPFQYAETNVVKLFFSKSFSHPGIPSENIKNVFKELR
ncbi:MAG: hypothetical protein E7473_11955 [Ruminococcaceae bacterium]|nr:hypothetical protein [Oscillospiraceae bacterium]